MLIAAVSSATTGSVSSILNSFDNFDDDCVVNGGLFVIDTINNAVVVGVVICGHHMGGARARVCLCGQIHRVAGRPRTTHVQLLFLARRPQRNKVRLYLVRNAMLHVI